VKRVLAEVIDLYQQQMHIKSSEICRITRNTFGKCLLQSRVRLLAQTESCSGRSRGTDTEVNIWKRVWNEWTLWLF